MRSVAAVVLAVWPRTFRSRNRTPSWPALAIRRHAPGSCILVRVVQAGRGGGFVVVDAVEVSYGISDGDTSNPGSASPESRVWSGHGPTHRTTQVRKITRITQRHRRQAGKTRTGSVGKRRRPCRRGSTTTLTPDECQRAWTDQPSQNWPQLPDRRRQCRPRRTQKYNRRFRRLRSVALRRGQ